MTHKVDFKESIIATNKQTNSVRTETNFVHSKIANTLLDIILTQTFKNLIPTTLPKRANLCIYLISFLVFKELSTIEFFIPLFSSFKLTKVKEQVTLSWLFRTILQFINTHSVAFDASITFCITAQNIELCLLVTLNTRDWD